MQSHPLKAAVLALSLSLGLVGAVQAHPKLLSASPAAGGVSPGPVGELRIGFSEEVFPKFSGVVVKTAAGKTVKTGAARVDPKNRRLLIVPLAAPLAPGAYSVEWHAVAADTHRVTGHYAFTVKPA